MNNDLFWSGLALMYGEALADRLQEDVVATIGFFRRAPWWMEAEPRILDGEGGWPGLKRLVAVALVLAMDEDSKHHPAPLTFEARRVAERKVLADLRREYSHEYKRPQPMVPDKLGIYEPSAEDVFFQHSDWGPQHVLDALQELATERQWDIAETYAATGSPTETARLLGLKHRQAVISAMRRLRRKAERAGFTHL